MTPTMTETEAGPPLREDVRPVPPPRQTGSKRRAGQAKDSIGSVAVATAGDPPAAPPADPSAQPPVPDTSPPAKNTTDDLATPEAALDSLGSFDGPVLLDLDETLYLRNSTEDFIDSAWPALPVMLALKLLDLMRPWRWTGGYETRDVWRVGLVSFVAPWVWLIWRRRCRRLAAQFGNAPLVAAALARQSLPTIATVGFRPIVLPLIAALGLAGAPVIAARLRRFSDRSNGKLALVVASAGEDVLMRSLVITDSKADGPLLDRCARPFRVVWPAAYYRPAFSGLYYPGRYLLKIKRPDDRLYIVRSILWEDFTLWILCSVAMSALPLQHVAALLLLLVSFWSIYERGYVDNDLMAQRYERKPTLSRTFGVTEVSTPRALPWIWAAASGLAAIALLRWPLQPDPATMAIWAAVLLATGTLFRIYNRMDKPSRVWLYPGLQLARSAAFVAVVPVVPVAVLALGSHAIAKWIPYLLYRVRREGEDWPEVPVHLVRLVVFAMLAVIALSAGQASVLLDGSAAAILLFFCIKARKDIRGLVRSAHRIDRSK